MLPSSAHCTTKPRNPSQYPFPSVRGAGGRIDVLPEKSQVLQLLADRLAETTGFMNQILHSLQFPQLHGLLQELPL